MSVAVRLTINFDENGTDFNSNPLAHRAKRGARVLISTCVESVYTLGDWDEKFYVYLYIYIYIYIYIYRYLFTNSGHSRMPCASSGTGILLTEPYLDPYWSKSIWSRSFFPCMDLLQVVYIIWTLKPVNDLRPANEIAFLLLAASFTFAGHLCYWTIDDLKEHF